MAAITKPCPVCRGARRTLSEWHADPSGVCLCCGGEGEATVLPPSQPPPPTTVKLAGLDVGAEVTDDAAGLGLTVKVDL